MLMRLDADVGASLRVGVGLRIPLRIGVWLSASTRDSLAVRGRRSSVGSWHYPVFAWLQAEQSRTASALLCLAAADDARETIKEAQARSNASPLADCC